MDFIPSLVIKVSYGDMLRRFSAPVNVIGQLDLDVAGLRAKIISLFNLPADSELTLTYIDEDGDVVTLVDDNDLRDVMKQNLKFLRINVQLKCENSANSSSGRANTGSSSPRAEDPLRNANKCIIDILNAVPEPLRETISNLSVDLASKAVSTSPVVVEILNSFSKLGQQASRPQESGPSAPAKAPKATTAPSADGLSRFDLNLQPPNDFQCPSVDGTKDDAKKTSGVGAGSSIECPFSGIPANNDWRMPFHKLPLTCHSKKGNNANCWTSTGIFHKGIQCDGCGVVPITGPRFKSKVKEDYDLCSVCFSEMGHEKDYIRMDRPVPSRHAPALKGKFVPGQNRWFSHHPAPPFPSGGLNFRMSKPLDSRFISDVNVLDGTVMVPSTPFTKIWRMRNNGSLMWPHGTQLLWIGGDRLSDSVSVELEIPRDGGVPIDGELDVAVDFTAPESPGRYISYWRMASPSGVKFGQRVWVLIHVDASVKESILDPFGGLNFNASPDINGRSGNPQSSNGFTEAVKPVSDENLNKESRTPNKDSVPAADVPGIVLPSTPRAPSSSSVSYPIIDLDETAPVQTSGEASATKDVPVSSGGDDKANYDIENVLLKELEEMGFKQVDVNKEILRQNAYNLEQSLNALCGVGDWDPMLDELQEMGFRDEETNKRLLKKNNGSIKRVVMDLLTGEKA